MTAPDTPLTATELRERVFQPSPDLKAASAAVLDEITANLCRAILKVATARPDLEIDREPFETALREME